MPDRDESVRGTLFLVVGPSGAGKDTLIDGARDALSEDGQYAFPAREITRPADAGGEAHIPLDVETFLARVAAGAYAFHWGAHGLYYGVPARVLSELNAGRHVVVNVSRSIIEAARASIHPVRILSIELDEAVLRERLRARGREDADDVDARIARAAAYDVAGDDVIRIPNDGPIAAGVAAFVDALTRRT